jgi:hypothetical protein
MSNEGIRSLVGLRSYKGIIKSHEAFLCYKDDVTKA